MAQSCTPTSLMPLGQDSYELRALLALVIAAANIADVMWTLPQGGEATSARLGPKDSANVGKLQRMQTSSRNRFATVMQPLADEP